MVDLFRLRTGPPPAGPAPTDSLPVGSLPSGSSDSGEPPGAQDARERLLALTSRSRDGENERTGSAAPVDPGRSVDGPSGPDRLGPRLARRWLPESWLRSRLDPGRAGCLGVMLASVVIAVVVVVLVRTDRPSAEPVPRLPVLTSAASAPSTSAKPEELVISIVGRVHDPGLVAVEPGDRVADALKAAGGPLPGTEVLALNLARKLADGEQLYVGVPVPPQARESGAPGPSGGGPAASDRKIDLNSASEEALEVLPGVGPVTAGRIVQWRTEHDGFDSVDQLRDVSGIGEVRFSRLQDLVRV